MSTAKEILQKYSVFLLDCDGVIWKGTQPIPGVSDAINYIKSIGKRVYYVTNNSSKTRENVLKKLVSFGINADSSEIISTASTTAYYLKSIHFDKKVYVIGENGLVDELKQQGIDSYGLEDNDKEFNYENLIDLHDDVGAVVSGLDTKINYLKLSKAVQYLREKKEESNEYKHLFISTNTDETFPYNEGRIVVGSGSLLSVLELTAERKPDVIIGKPYKYMMECIQSDAHCTLGDMLMVGDRLDKDIAFGNLQHVDTLCVLTGITSQETLDHLNREKDKDLIPTFVLDSFSSFNQQ